MTVDRTFFSRGSQNSLYVAVDTWANLYATYSSTAYNNCKFRCTDGAGFDVVCVSGSLLVSSPLNSKTTLSSSSGVATVNMHDGYGAYDFTLTENVTSWAITNLPASGEVLEKIINVIQHASAAKTVASPASANRTAGGIAWVADTTLSSREALLLRVDSAGVVTLFPTGRQV